MGQEEIDDGMDLPVTTEPDGGGATLGGQTVTVDVPKVDLQQLNQGEWSASMTECLEDVPVCVFGCLCPCLLMWRNAERLGENPLLYCLGSFFCPTMVALRFKTRQKYHIKDDIMTDVINSGCCCCCGLLSNCQVANEIRRRSH